MKYFRTRMITRRLILSIVVLIGADTVQAQGSDAQTTLKPIAPLINGLGNHHYPVSNCSGEAQQFFDQGLRLFYAFRYPESLASFREASRLDTDCAMTHWGEALAIGPSPNSRYLGLPDDPTQAGMQAIQRALELKAQASTKERRLIDAMLQRYDETSESDRTTRDTTYATAMRALVSDYKEDSEVATLFVEALMTKSAWDYWTPDGKPRPGTAEALDNLNRVLQRDLQHPGANHLYIHLLEDSLSPEMALPHAERLADSMPKVGHMVHMPTHIYIRTGLYTKAIKSNETSIDAANAFIKDWGDHDVPMGIASLSSSDRTHETHALDFIHMATVLQGNYARALNVAEKIAARSKANLGLAGGLQRRFAKPMFTLRRFGDWTGILKLAEPDDSFPLVKGIWHFVRGSALANTGQSSDALAELSALQEIAQSEDMEKLRAWVNSAAMLLKISAHTLEAEIENANGNLEKAIHHFESAIRIEDGLNYMEPPDWGHPVRHELGAVLLANGRAFEAETVFWGDLRRNPENGWALHGVWQSLVQQGKKTRAGEVEARFRNAWQDSDVSLKNGRAMQR